ncbi:MAG: sulfide-dependent adenosine diphosphate thiazole synthase [Sulfolobales archaeon]|nr:sulfide-dependent adenosine diphosphate thiazole synthase [Sulfolobales archaeon]
MIREADITRSIVRYALRDLEEFSEVDVVVVGAGPSGLTASYYLCREGFRVLVLERRFSFGGGTGPGGNLLPRIVFQEEVLPLLDEFGVRYVKAAEGLYVANPAEAIAKLAVKALDAGVRVLFGAHVQDLIYRLSPLRVGGVVWVWTPVHDGGYHVDPLFTESKAVVDATGHEAEVISIASKKIPELGLVMRGERSAYADLSERVVVEHTGKVASGLYVTGMAVANVYGLPRMGPIFGGMLLSGKKVAELITKDLSSRK